MMTKTLGPWDGTSVPPTGAARRPASDNPLEGLAVYPDGTETSVLEDRSADFPDEAAQAVEVVAEPTGSPEPVEVGVILAEPQFDPSAHTVAEVQAYLGEHPDETDAVLDREREGKARVTLLNPKEN